MVVQTRSQTRTAEQTAGHSTSGSSASGTQATRTATLTKDTKPSKLQTATPTPLTTVRYSCGQCKIYVQVSSKKKKPSRPRCKLCNLDLCQACTTGPHLKNSTHHARAISRDIYCSGMGRTFLSKKHKNRHFKRLHNPATQYRCCDCELDFTSSCHLERHFKEVSHAKRLVCPKCQTVFTKQSGLNQHLAKHKDVQCIGSTKCKREFARFADMVQHLESGACCSKLNRAKVHELLLQHDTAKAITIPGVEVQRLSPASVEIIESLNTRELSLPAPEMAAETTTIIEELDANDSDDEGEGGVPILTPESTPPVSRRTSISSTLSPGILTPTNGPASFEQDFTKCPLCPDRDFISATALKMHLQSAAHTPPVYRCPTFLFDIPGQDNGKALQREFKTLGGLLSHLQSGRCAGGQEMLETALKFVEGKLSAGGVKLLAKVS